MEGMNKLQQRLFEETNMDVGKATRNANFQMIKNDLPEKRQRVYEVIIQNPKGITRKGIAKTLGWAINCVTGRVTELKNAGLIVEDGIEYTSNHDGSMHPNTLVKPI